MEITEYERKFEELSRYATYLGSGKMAQTVTFSGLNVKVQEQQYDSGKRNWQNQNRNQISGQFKRQNQGPIRGQSSNIIPQCPKCKKNHNGDCYFGKNVCYKCGEPGHYVLQCRAEPVKVNDQTNKGKARVFAMT
ncbi:Pepsin-retropepsin like protein [Abeliophyllum distichum]|uniref:Pepsin-retropepsin like protein n=1 Tax=Abeliophyllum distichum TaxID=126358 RepID=A0ABD1PEB9_9LAMI